MNVPASYLDRVAQFERAPSAVRFVSGQWIHSKCLERFWEPDLLVPSEDPIRKEVHGGTDSGAVPASRSSVADHH